MGCLCTNSNNIYEIVLDEAFSYLKVRKISYSILTRELDQLEDSKASHILTLSINKSNPTNLKYLTETNFQSFINKFLLCENNQDYSKTFFKYWMDVYHSYSVTMQLPVLKFTLLCLCMSTSKNNQPANEDFEFFSSVFDLYKKYKSFEISDDVNIKNFVTVDDVITLLKEYIKIIMPLTIDTFKDFHEDPEAFRIYLSTIWTKYVINEFIIQYFFNKIDSFSAKVEVRKFVKKNWSLLKDDVLLRSKLSEFAHSLGSKKDGDGLILTESDSKLKIR